MLRQLREGLQLYGLIDVMERNGECCRGLFVAGDDDKVSPAPYGFLNQRHVSSSVALNKISLSALYC